MNVGMSLTLSRIAIEAGKALTGRSGIPWPTASPQVSPAAPTASGVRTMLLIPRHVNTLMQPGSRPWEISLALLLGVCALALRRSRLPSLPSIPELARADPFAVAWTCVRLRRPTVPDLLWAIAGGLAAALFIGGPLAVPAALFGAIGTLIALARSRAKAGMRRKIRTCAQVPPLADLFAAALAAGLQPADAALTVAQAFGGESLARPSGRNGPSDRTGSADRAAARIGRKARTESDSAPPMSVFIRPREPTGRRERGRAETRDTDLLACRFHDAATALLAGTDAQAAWSALAQDEATAPLAAAVIRAGRTGAPAAATVGRAARELRETASAALLAEVRAVGVRATAPLAICFLPAFVFLGVLPTALGLLSRVHA